MKRIGFIICFLIFAISLTACACAEEELSLSVIIKEYEENGSHIKYPQIEGLKDGEKQNSINNLLKEQVFLGAKDYSNKPFVDFSNPDYVYDFECGVGLINHDIASFWYEFDAYGEVHVDDGVMRDTSRFYGTTIDMKTGKTIELPNFMIIDERIINSSDGINIEPDYNGVIKPTFHRFKDAFMIYTSEDEKDNFHIFTAQEIIDILTDTDGETNWYIDEDINVVFSFDENLIKIPYHNMAELIYPQYLDRLNKYSTLY